jgi:phosphoribosylformylglycinamidine cyclo-ligase
LPRGSWVELERSTWSPPPVFRILSSMAGNSLESAEGTWNLGVGMIAVVAEHAADRVIERLAADGIPAWEVGRISTDASRTSATGDGADWEQGAKGVDGGAVRLVGNYAD